MVRRRASFCGQLREGKLQPDQLTAVAEERTGAMQGREMMWETAPRGTARQGRGLVCGMLSQHPGIRRRWRFPGSATGGGWAQCHPGAVWWAAGGNSVSRVLGSSVQSLVQCTAHLRGNGGQAAGWSEPGGSWKGQVWEPHRGRPGGGEWGQSWGKGQLVNPAGKAWTAAGGQGPRRGGLEVGAGRNRPDLCTLIGPCLCPVGIVLPCYG